MIYLKKPGLWISVAIHMLFLGWLVGWHTPHMEKSPTAYEQLIKGQEAKIVFYKFRDKLPDVKPVVTDSAPPKAEIVIPKQRIVSSPKQAPQGLQVVIQQAPPLVKEVPSPNILALQAAAVRAPERRKFVAAEMPKQERAVAQPKALDAPAVLEAKAAPSPAEALGAAPALRNENLPRFHAPLAQSRVAAPAATPEMGSAPEVATSPVTAGADNPLNLAVVGLKPAEANALPAGSRAAEFSAGPKLNPNGGSGAGKSGLTVPDLFVSGGGAEAKPTLMAGLRAAPTSAASLREIARGAAPAKAEEPHSPTENGGAARVSSAPHAKFSGREVYTMAIQMPNITSYSGSWLMWYAGRKAGAGPIHAPLPLRKVDPKYIATAAEERIEGRVQLLCVIRGSGRVDDVELVRGIDDRLNESAIAALGKWVFTPATRGGEPVDVDVMVEIPFRLAPKVARP